MNVGISGDATLWLWDNVHQRKALGRAWKRWRQCPVDIVHQRKGLGRAWGFSPWEATSVLLSGQPCPLQAQHTPNVPSHISNSFFLFSFTDNLNENNFFWVHWKEWKLTTVSLYRLNTHLTRPHIITIIQTHQVDPMPARGNWKKYKKKWISRARAFVFHFNPLRQISFYLRYRNKGNIQFID